MVRAADERNPDILQGIARCIMSAAAWVEANRAVQPATVLTVPAGWVYEGENVLHDNLGSAALDQRAAG